VLFLLFGSSGAGKTAAINGLRGRIAKLAIHDFDEIGVPPDANAAWRQRANGIWLKRALDYQHRGVDLLLAGQSPFGEILAAPLATELDGLSACLLDCDDETRMTRIRVRGRRWLARVPGELQDYFNWAEWMRRHAVDPSWRQEIVRDGGAEGMRWERWAGWQEGDPRWRILVIDTSGHPIGAVIDDLTSWIARERELLASGRHPLAADALHQLE
jgi:hypothetical protein